uniref:RNA polymerase Rpb4/RPC9 core domain-containing protein n=1 Tax=Romanomermis culicivorax TaxID=13658 RepID=A0A915JYT9_ROMCU
MANVDVDQAEDATELKFPKEFENAETLMISEVFLLLEHRKNQSEQQEELTDTTETFIKTMNYTQRLAKFKNRDTIRAVRHYFVPSCKQNGAKNMHVIFEISRFANDTVHLGIMAAI